VSAGREHGVSRPLHANSADAGARHVVVGVVVVEWFGRRRTGRHRRDEWRIHGFRFDGTRLFLRSRPLLLLLLLLLIRTRLPPLLDGETFTRDGGGSNPGRTTAILVPLFVISFCFGGCWLLFEYAQLSKRRHNRQQQQPQQFARLPFMH
jgi:hypothetical protein